MTYTIPEEVRQALGVGPEPILEKTDGHPWGQGFYDHSSREIGSYQESEKQRLQFLRSHRCEPKPWDNSICRHCDKQIPPPRKPTKAERIKAIQDSNTKSARRSDYYDAILRSGHN